MGGVLISNSSGLAAMTFAAIRLAVEAWPESSIALALWKAATMGRDPLKGRAPRLPHTADAPIAPQTFRVKDIDTSLLAIRRQGAIDSSDFPAPVEMQGHDAKIRALNDEAFGRAYIDTFLSSGAATDIMCRTIDAPPVVASGVA